MALNTRELVLEMLQEIIVRQEYSHLVIRQVLDKHNYLREEEKSFIKRVCVGTLEHLIQIDYVLNQFSKVKVNKMKPIIRNILRMSVYQLLYMDAVPDSAVCNEAVKLAEKKKFTQLKGFVNGVLRTIARQKEEICYPQEQEGEAEYLSILYSMPRFLVEMWLKTYDVDTLKRILHGLLEERPVTIRIDETLSSEAKKELLASMEACGIAVQLHPYLPYAYEVKNMTGVSTLPGFAEGEVMIQDVSSMLAVQAAGIREHDHILDVCAAPGGKSLHMACKLRGTGLVEALDVSDYKVNMIQENIDRMGYHNITASVEDATRQQSTRIQSADIVLADVPCSGLGVIAKKSDIKYRVTEQSLTEITVLQKAIIHNVQAYVKPGGILLYSTCTIHDTENEEMIRWIQEQYPFELESIDPYIDEVLQNETTARGYLQILPDIHQADGFFLARLRRKRS